MNKKITLKNLIEVFEEYIETNHSMYFKNEPISFIAVNNNSIICNNHIIDIETFDNHFTVKKFKLSEQHTYIINGVKCFVDKCKNKQCVIDGKEIKLHNLKIVSLKRAITAVEFFEYYTQISFFKHKKSDHGFYINEARKLLKLINENGIEEIGKGKFETFDYQRLNKLISDVSYEK